MNGWKNRATWNLVLWLTNDEPLYRFSIQAARMVRGDVANFAALTAANLARTPDGVETTDPAIDWAEILGAFDEDLLDTIAGACEANECFDADELEDYARKLST